MMMNNKLILVVMMINLGLKKRLMKVRSVLANTQNDRIKKCKTKVRSVSRSSHHVRNDSILTRWKKWLQYILCLYFLSPSCKKGFSHDVRSVLGYRQSMTRCGPIKNGPYIAILLNTPWQVWSCGSWCGRCSVVRQDRCSTNLNLYKPYVTGSKGAGTVESISDGFRYDTME